MKRLDATTYLNRPTVGALAVLACSAMAFCLLIMASGCNDATAKYAGYKRIVYPDGTSYQEGTDQSSVAHGPAASTQPAVASAGPGGVNASGSGTFAAAAKTASDYMGENYWILYGVGAVAVVIGSLLIYRKGITEGLCVIAGGGLLIIAPSMLSALDGLLPWIGALAVLIGVAIYFGRKLSLWQEGKATVKAAVSEAENGNAAAALAALLTHPAVHPDVAAVTK